VSRAKKKVAWWVRGVFPGSALNTAPSPPAGGLIFPPPSPSLPPPPVAAGRCFLLPPSTQQTPRRLTASACFLFAHCINPPPPLSLSRMAPPVDTAYLPSNGVNSPSSEQQHGGSDTGRLTPTFAAGEPVKDVGIVAMVASKRALSVPHSLGPVHYAGNVCAVAVREPGRAREGRRRERGQVHDRPGPDQHGLRVGQRGHQLDVSHRRQRPPGQVQRLAQRHWTCRGRHRDAAGQVQVGQVGPDDAV